MRELAADGGQPAAEPPPLACCDPMQKHLTGFCRFPSPLAIAFKAEMMATMSDPKQIEPNDVVVARLKDGATASWALVNHHAPMAPEVVQWPTFVQT